MVLPGGDTMNIPIKIDQYEEDWQVILNFLPEGWRDKAKELGALTRQRNFKDAELLLRVLLIYFIDGCSLRETVLRARLGNIADISDVALLKRLNKSGEWFRWMSTEMMNSWIRKLPGELFPEGLNIRVIDASHVSEPGKTGSVWRIHYSINLLSLRCDEVKITGISDGETFKRFSVNTGDLLIADRGYCHSKGIEHVFLSGGDVLVRLNLTNLPLYSDGGSKKFDILNNLRTLKGTEIGDWPVYVKGDKKLIKGRLCAIRKSKFAANKAKEKLLKEVRKKGRRIKPETLEAAEYIFIFTTLSKEILKPSIVLEMYRGRWQIELVFKKLKSIIGIGHLPKQDPVGAKAWIYGKIFVAFLIEVLLLAGEHFFPWGYPISQEVR